jgi:predicted molibdopterin-dependent oxidoreductase YjgC
METIRITVDGRGYEVPGGGTVLEACRAAGVEIPTLCYDARTEPYGACRLCIVEIEGLRGLPVSCTTPVGDGMVVRTDTPEIQNVRRTIVELLLAAGEHDCITCEASGECTLQRLAYSYGIEKPRFQLEKIDKLVDDGNPWILRDNRKCVRCGRCIRVCHEVRGQGVIDFVNRGYDAKVGTSFDRPLLESDCKFCGECIQACPVGAIVDKRARFKGRAADTTRVRTTCSYCGVGCQTVLHVADEKVVMVTGAEDVPPNYGMLCVKGRFGMDAYQHPDRLTTPLIRVRADDSVVFDPKELVAGGLFRKATWNQALDYTAKRITELVEKHGPDSFAMATSARATNESNYAAMKFARAVIGTNNVDHCARA